MIDVSSIVALGLAVGLAVVHFFSEQIHLPEGKTRWRIISLGAGISIGYLFLHLLPETYEEAAYLKHWIFVFLLAGFALVHLAEKFAYKHARSVKLVRELKVIHLVIFFGYYFLVGLSIEDKSSISILDAVLFLIPVAIHTALSTSSLAQMHGRVRESTLLKIFMSLAPVLGAIVAVLIRIPPALDSVFTSLIAGVLLYVFVKEFLPKGREGEPWFFVVGLVVYSVFTFVLNFVL